MTVLRLRGSQGSWGRAARLLVIVGVLGGCATSTAIQLPAELPLRTTDRNFEIRWALQREPTVVRAIGQIEYAIDTEYRLTLTFYGLDAEERIVSRGTTYPRSSFVYEPIPFVVELVPTGRETSFVLRVQDSRTILPMRR